MAEPDELTLTIARQLEVDWQYHELVEGVELWNTERVGEVRSAGRRAARLLGYRILTRQSDPADRKDGRIVVAVVVREAPNEAEAQRMESRALLLMNDFWARIAPSDSHGE